MKIAAAAEEERVAIMVSLCKRCVLAGLPFVMWCFVDKAGPGHKLERTIGFLLQRCCMLPQDQASVNALQRSSLSATGLVLQLLQELGLVRLQTTRRIVVDVPVVAALVLIPDTRTFFIASRGSRQPFGTDSPTQFLICRLRGYFD